MRYCVAITTNGNDYGRKDSCGYYRSSYTYIRNIYGTRIVCRISIREVEDDADAVVNVNAGNDATSLAHCYYVVRNFEITLESPYSVMAVTEISSWVNRVRLAQHTANYVSMYGGIVR